jgi:hypothetical protein
MLQNDDELLLDERTRKPRQLRFPGYLFADRQSRASCSESVHAGFGVDPSRGVCSTARHPQDHSHRVTTKAIVRARLCGVHPRRQRRLARRRAHHGAPDMFQLSWDSVIRLLQRARRLPAGDARHLRLAFQACDSCATSSWRLDMSTSSHRDGTTREEPVEVAAASSGAAGMRAAARRAVRGDRCVAWAARADFDEGGKVGIWEGTLPP